MDPKSSLVVCAVVVLTATQALADGDATAGKTVFQTQCAACHSIEPGKQGIGPSLAGVVGRESGTLPGARFTPAMMNAHLTWDAKTLDEFLAAPTQKVPGTAMPVSVPNPTARADVIAYLGTLRQAAAAPAPAPAPAAAPPAPVAATATPAVTQGNVAAGKTVFENQCSSCHSIEPGKQSFGPSLAGLIGRQSGTLPGFTTFTPAMM